MRTQQELWRLSGGRKQVWTTFWIQNVTLLPPSHCCWANFNFTTPHWLPQAPLKQLATARLFLLSSSLDFCYPTISANSSLPEKNKTHSYHQDYYKRWHYCNEQATYSTQFINVGYRDCDILFGLMNFLKRLSLFALPIAWPLPDYSKRFRSLKFVACWGCGVEDLQSGVFCLPSLPMGVTRLFALLILLNQATVLVPYPSYLSFNLFTLR